MRRVDLGALPASTHEAERLWEWAKEKCLPTFGPYEDAMSVRSRSLFHTRISSLLNLHRLVPALVSQMGQAYPELVAASDNGARFDKVAAHSNAASMRSSAGTALLARPSCTQRSASMRSASTLSWNARR